MGQAKRRGNFEHRRREAIKRNKRLAIASLGEGDTQRQSELRLALDLFLKGLGPEQWAERRAGVIEMLNGAVADMANRPFVPLRVQKDEIAWYLLLAELALDDPFSQEISQASRILPILTAIGMRLGHLPRVTGMDEKVNDALTDYRSDPDGTLFEILVGLSYAAAGWDVEFLASTPLEKKPDLRVTKGGRVLFVECKRLQRSSEYGEKERQKFLEMWDGVAELLIENRQWLWLRADFRTEVSSLPKSFLTDLLASALPAPAGETTIYDGPEAKIDVRHIDQSKVAEHMAKYSVKLNSPALTTLLGGDWAPLDSAVSVAHMIQPEFVKDSPIPFLGAYADKIGWASGITRKFSSARSIACKARDIRKRVADAVAQVPADVESVVHVAYETMDGPEVERHRFERVTETLKRFTTDKRLVSVRVHMMQAHQVLDGMWDFEETVLPWNRIPDHTHDIPVQVVVEPDATMRDGSHWEPGSFSR